MGVPVLRELEQRVCGNRAHVIVERRLLEQLVGECVCAGEVWTEKYGRTVREQLSVVALRRGVWYDRQCHWDILVDMNLIDGF